MKLNLGDRVANKSGTLGTVVAVDSHGPIMVKVQFDTGRAGWFEHENDDRLRKVNIRVTARGIDSDAAYADVAAVIGTDMSGDLGGYREITPETAVTIAQWWQSPGSIGHVLASFASGMEVDRTELLDDIQRTRTTCGYYFGQYHANGMEKRDREALDCLSTFIINWRG